MTPWLNLQRIALGNVFSLIFKKRKHKAEKARKASLIIATIATFILIIVLELSSDRTMNVKLNPITTTTTSTTTSTTVLIVLPTSTMPSPPETLPETSIPYRSPPVTSSSPS